MKNGNLHISLLPEAREEVKDKLGKSTDAAFIEIVETWLGTGGPWSRRRTSTLLRRLRSCLSDDIDYYYADYQVKSEVEKLLTKGVVVFRGAD